MPHATNSYPFESKVFAWANEFARRMTGHNARAFILLLDGDGVVRSLHFSGGQAFDAPEKDRLAATAPGHIFYDPFDFPEYGYLSWSGVGRAAMERVTGVTFTSGDFVRLASQAGRSSGREVSDYPECWGVMF